MLIQLSTITHLGLELEGDILKNELNERMNEGKNNDIEFTKDAIIKLKVDLQPVGYLVNGQISTQYKQPCGRCADQKDNKLNLNFVFSLIEGNPKDYEEGIVYYEGFSINIKNYLEELIILKLSPYLLPEIDKKLKCSLCKKVFNGKDLEKEKIDTQKPFADLKKMLH